MELQGVRHGWGPVKRDSDFAKETRRQNQMVREEFQTPTGEIDRKGKQGPLPNKIDVGGGKLMSVSEIARATGLSKGGVYARLYRNLNPKDLLKVRGYVAMPA